MQPVLDHTFLQVILLSFMILNDTLYEWCLLGVSIEKIIPWRNYVTSCALLLGDASLFLLIIQNDKVQKINGQISTTRMTMHNQSNGTCII